MGQSLFKEFPAMGTLVPRYLEDDKWAWWSSLIWSGFIGLLLLGLLLAGSVMSNGVFLSERNITNVLSHQFLYLLVCLPFVALLFAQGSFDFSLGAMAGLVGMVFAVVLRDGSGVAAWLAALLVCLGFGFLNASLVGFLRIPGIIATLVTAALMRSLILVLSGGVVVLASFDNGLALQAFFWILSAAFFAAAIFIALRKTMVPQTYIKQAISYGWPFIAVAIGAGVMGLIVVNNLGAATLNAGAGFEIKFLAAIFLSGTWFASRRPNFIGLVLALLFVALCDNFFSLIGSPMQISQIATIIIILYSLGLQIGFHAIVNYFYKNRASPKA